MARVKLKQEPAASSLNLDSSRKKSLRMKPKLRGKNLELAVEKFQSEPDEKKTHNQWKRIEASVFAVQFED